MIGIRRECGADGKTTLELGGVWTEDMAAELQRGGYASLELSQVYDWGSYEKNVAEFATLVTSIQLCCPDDSLPGLERFANLEYLTLSLDGAVKYPPDLRAFAHLKAFTAYWHRDYAKSLPSLPKLEGCTIFSFPERDCALFASSKKLKRLSLTRGSIETLEGIQGLCLRDIELVLLSKLVDIGAVAGNKCLAGVHIENAKRIVDLAPLRTCQALERLYLFNCGRLEAIDWIASMSQMERLWIAIPVERVNWARVLKAPRLKLVGVNSPSNAFLSEDDLFRLVAENGRTLEKLSRGGTKRSPMFIVNLAGQ